ncbi:hypothetical protein D9M71_447050 [compost metagenome]
MVFMVTSGASQRRWRSCTTEPRWALKRTHFSPLRTKGSTSVACRLEVLAPVSILARRPATPRSGSATHSRRPITVKWSNVFKMLNRQLGFLGCSVAYVGLAARLQIQPSIALAEHLAEYRETQDTVFTQKLAPLAIAIIDAAPKSR